MPRVQMNVRFNLQSIILLGGMCLMAECLYAQAVPLTSPMHSDAGTPHRVPSEHLPNLIRLHARVLSGGLPGDAQAFAELRARGVHTLISVDGARPDVALAEQYGLQYVHLPHGYDGIPERRVAELAKAVSTLEGTIYVHCHHGEHRSPAAAAVACVTAGLLAPQHARSVLELAGTSGNYVGLYAAVERATPLTPSELDALSVEFHATAPVPPLAEAMVEMQETFDRLQALANHNWQADTTQPDQHAAHQALILREQVHELRRLPHWPSAPAAAITEPKAERQLAMDKWLQESEQLARNLEEWLLAASRLDTTLGETNLTDTTVGLQLLDRLKSHCQACHRRFRD